MRQGGGVKTSQTAQPQGGAAVRGFLSLSARVRVNLEALNMVESIGNVVRHRKATVIYRLGDKYELRTVPVISGEAIRHAIQLALVEVATQGKKLPVCPWCQRGEFIKRGILRDEFLNDLGRVEGLNSIAEKSIYEAEKAIIEKCVVEDVGGFLVPAETPIKRTSVLEVGYMVPAIVRGEGAAEWHMVLTCNST
jgi:CRISPR-associated protein Csa2